VKGGAGAVVKLSLRNSGIFHKLRHGHAHTSMRKRLTQDETGESQIQRKKKLRQWTDRRQQACPARGIDV